LSRGISTIDVLEIVLARAADGYRARCGAGVGWRFALSTSSISAFPARAERATLGAHCREDRDQAPMIESRNVGRTDEDFQCRVRIINGLFGRRFCLAADGSGTAQAAAPAQTKKSGASRLSCSVYVGENPDGYSRSDSFHTPT
jgi:hypothetical protein